LSVLAVSTRVTLVTLSTLSTILTVHPRVTFRSRGQLDLINVRADFLDRIINSVMILHMGLRALNRLTRQLHIPISHTRLLSKGEYPSRHQAVSSLKDTGPLFPLSPATIRIR